MNAGKRAMDILLACLLLIVTVPLQVLIAAMVFVDLGWPVLFRQPRPGLSGRPFCLVKFRTMKNQFDDSGRPLSNESRLTRFGKLLRSSSLDELPELWNVLVGDMSLVGPRPLLMEYLPMYTPRQRRRHEVRPGITGWAQINGRNLVPWEERFEMDVWYVDHRTFWLDLRILFATAGKIFSRQGVSTSGRSTIDRFHVSK